MAKRLIFALLLIPFMLVCGFLILFSGVWWVFTGKTLLYLIDRLTIKMNGIL